MLRSRHIDYRTPPPSEHLKRGELAFYYVLGLGGLIMFLIGFCGLPVALLSRWFGGV